ncbi:hypothetical protein GTQ40_11065 [Flavobacteriaceae bacterium R38]|nr:hypothetical protein [Flavobacteriaceae bacterium R38]
MNFTEEYALQIGKKVLKDTELWDTDVGAPSVRFDDGKYLHIGENTWLVSFPYGAEDFGRDDNGKSRASMHVTIFDDDGIATSVSYRNGNVRLDYDKENDKYSIKEQRP